jgi:hypothetical protein
VERVVVAVRPLVRVRPFDVLVRRQVRDHEVRVEACQAQNTEKANDFSDLLI